MAIERGNYTTVAERNLDGELVRHGTGSIIRGAAYLARNRLQRSADPRPPPLPSERWEGREGAGEGGKGADARGGDQKARAPRRRQEKRRRGRRERMSASSMT